MQRRRWLQFSLQFLFAVILTAACVAWWFRPGIVKPEFALERFSRDNDAHSDKEHFEAQFRLTNAGPDSIWLDELARHWRIEGKDRYIGEVDKDGWKTVASGSGIGFGLASHSQRIRLKPGESCLFVVPLDDDVRTVQLGVDISDRRDQREKRFSSQRFTIPYDPLDSPLR